MSWNREPSLPGITCPAIDDVQDGITKALEAANEAADQLNGQVRALEELRSANDSLRKYGEYWKDQHEELSKTYDEQQDEIRRLESLVEDLTSEVNELARQAA